MDDIKKMLPKPDQWDRMILHIEKLLTPPDSCDAATFCPPDNKTIMLEAQKEGRCDFFSERDINAVFDYLINMNMRQYIVKRRHVHAYQALLDTSEQNAAKGKFDDAVFNLWGTESHFSEVFQSEFHCKPRDVMKEKMQRKLPPPITWDRITYSEDLSWDSDYYGNIEMMKYQSFYEMRPEEREIVRSLLIKHGGNLGKLFKYVYNYLWEYIENKPLDVKRDAYLSDLEDQTVFSFYFIRNFSFPEIAILKYWEKYFKPEISLLEVSQGECKKIIEACPFRDALIYSSIREEYHALTQSRPTVSMLRKKLFDAEDARDSIVGPASKKMAAVNDDASRQRKLVYRELYDAYWTRRRSAKPVLSSRIICKELSNVTKRKNEGLLIKRDYERCLPEGLNRINTDAVGLQTCITRFVYACQDTQLTKTLTEKWDEIMDRWQTNLKNAYKESWHCRRLQMLGCVLDADESCENDNPNHVTKDLWREYLSPMCGLAKIDWDRGTQKTEREFWEEQWRYVASHSWKGDWEKYLEKAARNIESSRLRKYDSFDNSQMDGSKFSEEDMEYEKQVEQAARIKWKEDFQKAAQFFNPQEIEGFDPFDDKQMERFYPVGLFEKIHPEEDCYEDELIYNQDTDTWEDPWDSDMSYEEDPDIDYDDFQEEDYYF